MTGGQGCPGDYNDAQHLHCPGQSDTEYMTEFAVYAISCSPLLVATDIRNMTDIMKKVLLNTEINEVNQQDETKAGVLNYYHDCNGASKICQVWTRQLNVSGTIAVAAVNIDDTEHEIVIDFSKLGMGWSSSTKVNIRDLWQHKDIGSVTGLYNVQVEAHGNFFAKLTASTTEHQP